MSGMLVSEENFSTAKYVMSGNIDDVQDPRYHMRRRTFFYPVNNVLCTWVYMGMDDSTWSECLAEQTSDFEPPEHVPRTSARAQSCVRISGGLPACHGAESTRKDAQAGEPKTPKDHKNTSIYIYICICIL